jgi:NodT family efflux transporter outer membrane factor (OMF) lipoprotein
VDADRELMRRTLEIRRKALELITAQERAGEISGLDLSRARSEVASAEADRLSLDQQRAELVHALAVLGGEMATGKSVRADSSLPEPPSIPAALPSEIVFQRPDVRASLHQVAAANAEIGVATAAMYPAFSINASTGVDASLIGKLVDADSMVWSLGANLVTPLSAQRLLRFRRDAVKAAHRASSADYRQTVIESVAEIENALQAAAILERRQAAQQEALDAARETYKRSLKRFESGLVSFLDVVDAERTLLTTSRQSNAIRAEALAVSVSLIKALGGRW